MRFLRLLVSPGGLAVLVVIGSIVVVEWAPAAVFAAFGGALAGWLAILAASQVGLLAAVPLAGMRVHRIVVGVGPRLVDWSRPDRALVIRALPVVLAVDIRAAKAPVRKRMWWSAVCTAVAELALVVVAAMWADGGNAFAHGFAIACLAEFLYSLLPKRTTVTTSTGWLLFRLPWVDDEQARELEAAPLVGEAIEAAQRGDVATAEQLAAGLRETYPDLRSALAARVFVLEAQGRYAEAMILAVKVAGDARQQPSEAASSFAALAGLTCATVEAGQLDSDLGLTTAYTALENAATLGYPAYKLNGVRALHALLRGDVDEAVSLASRAAEAGDSVLVRADDLATLARAHMAAGDNQAARAAISEAEKLASWWPRVAGTRSRLEVS